MTQSKGRKPINVELARQLRKETNSWPEAAARYNEEMKTSFATWAIYHAVWLVDGRQGKKPVRNDTNIRDHWRPPLPRPLRVIPDYRTNTSRPR